MITRRILVSLTLALLVGGTLFAQSYGSLSPEVEAIRGEYLSRGRLFPVIAFPVGAGQLARVAAEVGIEFESVPGGRAFVEVAGDGRLSSGATLIEPEAPRDGIDIRSAWVSRPALIRLGGGYLDGSGLSFEIEAELRDEWSEEWRSFSNIPSDAGPGYGLLLSNQMLRRGVLAWEGERARAMIGRDVIHLGTAGLSSFLPSDRLPYLDAARVDLPIGPFQLDWMIGTFLAIESWEKTDVDDISTTDPDIGFWLEDSWRSIIFVVHRLSYSTPRFRIGLAEQVFYARPSGAFELNDLLPVGTFHALDDIPDNMSLVLELSLAAAPGLALHFSAAYDDISSDIIGVADSVVPTIDAYRAAVEWQAPFGGRRIEGIGELGYTHYLFGNFDAVTNLGAGNGWEDPNYLAKHVARYNTDQGGLLLPFSSPYGPGALWFRHEASMQLGASTSLGLEAFVLSKTVGVSIVGTPYARDDSLQHAPRRTVVLIGASFEHEYAFGGITGGVRVAPAVSLSDGTASFMLDGTIRVSLGSGYAAFRQTGERR